MCDQGRGASGDWPLMQACGSKPCSARASSQGSRRKCSFQPVRMAPSFPGGQGAFHAEGLSCAGICPGFSTHRRFSAPSSRGQALSMAAGLPLFPTSGMGEGFFFVFFVPAGEGAAFPPLPERRGHFFGGHSLSAPLVQAAPGMGEEPPPGAGGRKAPQGGKKGRDSVPGRGERPVPRFFPGGAR